MFELWHPLTVDDATRSAALAAWMAIPFSLISAIATAWAAFAASRAVTSAEHAIELSRLNSERELRAYLVCKQMSTGKIIDQRTNRVVEYQFDICWENIGNTPARNCTTFNSMVFSSGEIDAESAFSGGGAISRGVSIGPKQESSASTKVTADDIKRLGGNRFYLIGFVEYHDIFEGTPLRRTEWAQEVIFNGECFNPETEVTVGYVPGCNSFDEDCPRRWASGRGV